MPPENSAAWLPAKSGKPLKVGPAPYTSPAASEIVVKNGAVAINPVDWAKQLMGNMLLGQIKYPFIIGEDVAGEVVEVGSKVQRFRMGDRVLGHAMAVAPGSNKPAEGGFQKYTVIREMYAASIPEWISYEQACVLPLTLSTAAYGLFHKDFLALDSAPTVPPPPPTVIGNNRAIFITGGSSSVGSNAIQLAVSAGYQVYATASPKNFAYVEKLGATRVFDYHSTTVIDDVITALNGKTLAGAYASIGGIDTCIKILGQVNHDSKTGANKNLVAVSGFGLPAQRQLSTSAGTATFMASTIWTLGRNAILSLLRGVRFKFVDGKDFLEDDNVVSRLVYRDFLPRALAARQFVPAPEPLVVGQGLDRIQEAMEVHEKGVSAKKVVVLL
ncbi:MAG: hypothetical protein Q9160_007747 [Pyrenula sp. 1 TL-2023]